MYLLEATQQKLSEATGLPLLSLERLRERMPSLRRASVRGQMELQSIAEQTRERATYLHLAEALSAFLTRLREAADTLDIIERQRIVRLLFPNVRRR